MKNDGESVYYISVGTQVKNDETKIENKQKKHSLQVKQNKKNFTCTNKCHLLKI